MIVTRRQMLLQAALGGAAISSVGAIDFSKMAFDPPRPPKVPAIKLEPIPYGVILGNNMMWIYRKVTTSVRPDGALLHVFGALYGFKQDHAALAEHYDINAHRPVPLCTRERWLHISPEIYMEQINAATLVGYYAKSFLTHVGKTYQFGINVLLNDVHFVSPPGENVLIEQAYKQALNMGCTYYPYPLAHAINGWKT